MDSNSVSPFVPAFPPASVPPIPAPPMWNWPSAALGAVVVTGGLIFDYKLVEHGITIWEATKYTLALEIPLLGAMVARYSYSVKAMARAAWEARNGGPGQLGGSR